MMQTIRLRHYSDEEETSKIIKWLRARGIPRDCFEIHPYKRYTNGVEIYSVIRFADSVRLEGADLTEFVLRWS